MSALCREEPKRLGVLLLVLFFLGPAICTLCLPYHHWDALAFGEWSRLLAMGHGFFFDTITDLTYQRPFFYVLQGLVWRLTGFHEVTGRALALCFALLFLWSFQRLAREILPPQVRCYLPVFALAPFFVPDFLVGFASGTTDVPAAALVTACAAVLWTYPSSPVRAAGLVALSCSAALCKPTASAGIFGLALAHALGHGRAVSQRAKDDLLLAAGGGIALSYWLFVAHHVHESLSTLLTGPLGSYYSDLARESRLSPLRQLSWLGPGLGPLAVAAILVSIARIFGLRRRRSAAVITAIVVLSSLLVQAAALKNEPVFPPGGVVILIVLVALTALAVAFALSGGVSSAGADPMTIRLLLWAAPGVALWMGWLAYDTRLLSPAWTPLLLLIGVTFGPDVCLALASARGVAVIGAGIGMILLLLSTKNVDDLDAPSGRRLLRSVLHGDVSSSALRWAVAPSLEEIRRAVQGELQSEGTGPQVFASDGRMRFFFPGRVNQSYPAGCSDLVGYRVFVLRTDAVSRRYLEKQLHVSGDPSYWAGCDHPRLAPIAEGASYVVFRVSLPPDSAQSAASLPDAALDDFAFAHSTKVPLQQGPVR